MITRAKQAKWGKAVWCALCAIAITLAPLLDAMFFSPLTTVTA
ncbi:hypothetical protein [Bifidobacterium sp. ESL0745]|nr:hypothetical protein [Bifidobacterium sp. ESL0745]MDF7664745.1 hypothetical protein [Bifidobacterium sp. ESL0745]